MVEELNIQGSLRWVNDLGLTAIERVLAAHTGTVQLLVSLWFAEPAAAIVKWQQECDAPGGGLIRRQVALTLQDSGLEVVLADSAIPLALNSPDVLRLVREKKLGLGQIAVALEIPTFRVLVSVQATDQQIRRKYIMRSIGPVSTLHYEIEETFPRALYGQPDTDHRLSRVDTSLLPGSVLGV